MLVYKPTYTALIRTLSFTSATAREDLLVLPNLARVLSQASNLHSLVIIIPQPSIPFFMRQLTVYGIIRKPPSKILDIRNQQNPTGHDVRSTLHSLRSLCLGENFDLLPIARYRQLTRMVLHQCLEYEELNDVFHALAPDGSNPRLQAFGVNIRHHMPVGEIVKVIGETFPKLRWFAITQRMCDWKVIVDTLSANPSILPYISTLAVNPLGCFSPVSCCTTSAVLEQLEVIGNYSQRINCTRPSFEQLQLGCLILVCISGRWYPSPTAETLHWWFQTFNGGSDTTGLSRLAKVMAGIIASR